MTLEELGKDIPVEERKAIIKQLVKETFPDLQETLKEDK